MRRMKLVGLSVMAVLALSAFVVSPAFAGTKENPVWWTSSGELSGSLGITAKAAGTQTLKGTGITINCTGVSVNAGAVLKSGIPGTDEETLTYTGCAVSGHESTCEVNSAEQPNGTISTNALESKLAFKTKLAAEGKEAKASKSVTVFKPATGTVFVDINLSGSCGFVPSETSVKGEVIADNVSTNEGATELATSHEISAKNEEKYFTNPGAKESKASLKAFGLAASYTGNVTVSSASSYSVEG
jgi:hypothetical protein